MNILDFSDITLQAVLAEMWRAFTGGLAFMLGSWWGTSALVTVAVLLACASIHPDRWGDYDAPFDHDTTPTK